MVVVIAGALAAGSWIETAFDLSHAIDLRAGEHTDAETLARISQAARGARRRGW